MKAHHPLGDTEIDRRIRPGRLSPRDDGGYDEALMPAPAHTELEVPERVAEAGDVESPGHLEREQAGGAVKARRKGVAEAGMINPRDGGVVGEPPGDREGRSLVRLH